MRETLRHRGPDGEGVFVSPDCRAGLGHRRLAIVDLANGSQPMMGSDGEWLVFNGEIYNYPDLRRRLIADGVRFETRCDTEVILHLYRRYGKTCVEHLTGMFAFAIWDAQREQMFFARDPIGEKPLYWADCQGSFLFASEIKALLMHPAVTRDVNRALLSAYLANLVVPAPDTLFAGINKLPAGCRGTCDGRGVVIERYRSVSEPRTFASVEEHEAIGRVRELLDNSVHDRLMSDVPVGVLLSGGMDSSTIVALLRERAAELASFTVAFPGQGIHDERAEARWVSERFGTPHHEVALSETDAMAILPKLVRHADEPLADPVCVPLYAVCRLAREHGVRVLLAGEGADELFWGYHGYQAVVERWRRYAAMLALPRPVRRLAARFTSPDRHPRRREQLEALALGRANAVHMPVGMTSYQRHKMLPSLVDGVGWGPGADHAGEDPLTTLAFDTQEYEFHVRLPELLLMRIDRFSMANGVEARVPFLDPVLVDYGYRLPLDLKVRGGTSKWILKKAVADVVPPRVSTRRKQGFAAPTSQWFFQAHGHLLRELILHDSLRAYFDVDYVGRLLATADRDSWETGQILWPILNFGLWHKFWIEQQPLDDLLSLRAATSTSTPDPVS
jgi:asparagine synthase (glutamine-hydrolysing)